MEKVLAWLALTAVVSSMLLYAAGYLERKMGIVILKRKERQSEGNRPNYSWMPKRSVSSPETIKEDSESGKQ